MLCDSTKLTLENIGGVFEDNVSPWMLYILTSSQEEDWLLAYFSYTIRSAEKEAIPLLWIDGKKKYKTQNKTQEGFVCLFSLNN